MKLSHIILGGRWKFFVMAVLSLSLFSCSPGTWFCDRMPCQFDDGSSSVIRNIKNATGKSTLMLNRPTVMEIKLSMPTDVHLNIDSLKCMFDNSEEPFYLKGEHFYMDTINVGGKKIMTVGMAKDLIYGLYSKNERTYKDTGKRFFYILPCSFLTKGGVNVLNDTVKVKWW